MRFIDEAIIEVRSGHGGPGHVSFRREKYVPRGGPDGGDGGRGADVIFVSDAELSTLQDFRFRRKYKGPDGERGGRQNCAGLDAENIFIRIPRGTIISDADSGEELCDFKEDAMEWVAAKGGRGGKGNTHFATAKFQAPKFAQPGEDGEYRKLRLELKLLADVGLIGMPNAGKSSLISRLSHAKPKIADYPFTTLTPVLGVVQLPSERSIVVADIPGLIEGAHEGRGLGIRFLKHVERTRILVHVLDLAETLGAEKPAEILLTRYQAIRNELAHYSEALTHKPEIVVLNKSDLIPEDEQVAISRSLKRDLRGHLMISAVSGSGIQQLVQVLDQYWDEVRRPAEKAPTPVALPHEIRA